MNGHLEWSVHFDNTKRHFLYGQNSTLDSLNHGRRPVPGVGMLISYLLEPQQRDGIPPMNHRQFISVVLFNTDPMFEGTITVTCGNQDVQCHKNVTVVSTG